MNHLKFKAFHKQTKRVFDVGMIDFINKCINAIIDSVGGFYTYRYCSFNDIELMPFINLNYKDYNEEDLYKDYIVEVTFNKNINIPYIIKNKDDKDIGKIDFFNGSPCIKFKKGILFFSTIKTNDIDIKVLGNIHQNPELLQNNKHKGLTYDTEHGWIKKMQF